MSADIDMALYAVTRLAGEDVARQVQLIIEYDPHPPAGPIDWDHVDRSSLAPVEDQWITEALAGEPELIDKLRPSSTRPPARSGLSHEDLLAQGSDTRTSPRMP